MKPVLKRIAINSNYSADVTISEDKKREGFLIGHYQGNIPRVLYGKNGSQF
jgi:hypothetical protein